MPCPVCGEKKTINDARRNRYVYTCGYSAGENIITMCTRKIKECTCDWTDGECKCRWLEARLDELIDTLTGFPAK